jgi:hypothetical protein
MLRTSKCNVKHDADQRLLAEKAQKSGPAMKIAICFTLDRPARFRSLPLQRGGIHAGPRGLSARCERMSRLRAS